MKKAISLALALVLGTSFFAGCGSKTLSESEISKKIDTAFSLLDKQKSADLTHTVSMNYDFGSYAYATTTKDEIRETAIGTSKYEMSDDISITGMGSTTTYETFYKNGWFYTDRYGGKLKTKRDADEVSSASRDVFFKVTYADMKTVGLKDTSLSTGVISDPKEKDALAISFTCKVGAMKKYIEEAFQSENRQADDINVTGGSGEYVLSKSGRLISQSLRIKAGITADGESSTVTVSYSTAYKSIDKSVDPYDPEDKEYTEIESLETAQGLQSALYKSLMMNDINMTAEITSDITQQKTSAGYERSYHRIFSGTNKKLLQEVNTKYKSSGKAGADYVSAMYYDGSTYYNRSDMYQHKIYCQMDFNTFFTNIYSGAAKTPADIYLPGMMKDLKSSTAKNGDTVYTFSLQPSSEQGVDFLEMIFSPYEQFSGDCSTAKVTVNKFSGKCYVNSNGYYYKTEMSCDLKLQFKEGDIAVKATHDIKIDNIGKATEIKFPKFTGYEKIDKSDLLSVYNQSASGTSTTGN